MNAGDGQHRVFKNAVAPEHGRVDWGRLVWLSSHERSGVDATLGYVEISPHTSNPTHRHHTCSETLFLLEGRLDHLVGPETVTLEAGDVLVVPPGLAHGATNIGDSIARMVVVYDTGDRDFEPVE